MAGAMVGAIFAFVGAVTAAHYNIVANITQPSDSLDHKIDIAAKAFAERELEFFEEDKHVKREEIEKAIQDMANQSKCTRMKFAVVSGRILVGKSESIAAALKGRRGVIKVKLDRGDVTSVDTIKEKICNVVGLGNSSEHFDAVMEAVNKRLDKLPIVVIEIEKNATDPSAMKTAETFAKGCCWDNDYPCMVYIVPSDNASTDLLVQGQELRRELIWVGPMTEDEGKQLLGKYSDFKIGDTGLKAVDDAVEVGGVEGGYEVLFDIVGTHPADLKALALTRKNDRQKLVDEKEDGGSITWKIFNNKLASSRDDSQAVSDMKEGMKNLSKLLLNSCRDGILVSEVESPADEPKKVNAFMKATDTIPFIYHPCSKSYRFRTVFVEKAARKWKKAEELKRKEMEELKRKEVEELKKRWWWTKPKS